MSNSLSVKSRLETLRLRSKTLANPWVSEIVLQTNQYELMKLWYEAILGRDFFHETRRDPVAVPKPRARGDKQVFAKDVRACFMRLPTVEPYGMVLALFELNDIDVHPSKDPGLNHMQFKHCNIEALITRIEFMRDAGIDPHRSANHGPGTSFYFRDPDSNILELCIDNFDNPEDLDAFIKSETFRNNPSGLDIDRDAFIARYRSGIPVRELLAV